MLGESTHQGVGMAKKRKGGVAPYVALLIAVIIFVPAVREFFADLVGPLVQLVQDAFEG
ncbi:hypothetical protein [Saccharothrix sp. Mg75]|uniref:hypothetical protein n=1 Tax=Saccharothrix sp. Mg75 TaxID=3445357 RepID=UPI003EEFA97E